MSPLLSKLFTLKLRGVDIVSITGCLEFAVSEQEDKNSDLCKKLIALHDRIVTQTNADLSAR